MYMIQTHLLIYRDYFCWIKESKCQSHPVYKIFTHADTSMYTNILKWQRDKCNNNKGKLSFLLSIKWSGFHRLKYYKGWKWHYCNKDGQFIRSFGMRSYAPRIFDSKASKPKSGTRQTWDKLAKRRVCCSPNVCDHVIFLSENILKDQWVAGHTWRDACTHQLLAQRTQS